MPATAGLITLKLLQNTTFIEYNLNGVHVNCFVKVTTFNFDHALHLLYTYPHMKNKGMK
jgi:hypothetical protein